MITSKADYKDYLSQDRVALGQPKELGSKQMIKQLFWPDKTFQFERALRKYEYLHNCRKKNPIWLLRYFFAKYKHRKLSLQLGFTIGPH